MRKCKEVPILLTSKANVGERGELKGFIAVVKDITEPKQTQESQKGTMDQLIARQSKTIIDPLQIPNWPFKMTDNKIFKSS